MGHVTTMRMPTSSRPRATTTLPTASGEMWWKSSTPATVLKAINAEMALHMLDRSPAVNRGVKQHKVDQYARVMAAGLWRPVEEQCDAMAFDLEGRCINGQHRLWSVVESKKTITFEIKLGLPTAAIDTIDDHLPRSDADVYQITHAGDASSRHMAVAVRLLTSGGRPKGGFDRPTKIAALEQHKGRIDRAMALVPMHSVKIKGLNAASMLAVLTRATHTVPIERLQRFTEVLQTGRAALNEGAAILLRDWMMQNGALSSTLQSELYWKAERALRAFLDRDDIKILYAAQAELFPLPGEVITKKADALAPRRLRERQAKRGKRG